MVEETHSMRMALIWAVMILAGVSPAQAQSDQAAAEPAIPNRSYQLLRENEDWSFLEDSSLRRDVWDPIKYIPLRGDAQDWYLAIGGEVRQVWERVRNDNWGTQPYLNSFWLQRYMGQVDAHYGRHVRSFVQLKSGLEFFRQGGARPIDEKKLDFEAGFAEVGTSGPRNWIVLRAGRQELNYGSGRLVSVREGPNVRQSFDGFKIRSKLGDWHIDEFAVRPDLDKPGFFDNVPDHHTAFWGVYATRPLARGISLDTYYLGIDRAAFTYDRGTAPEVRHSLATRLWRPVATASPAWDCDYEGVFQFGSFGSANIRAWTVASDTGYSFPTAPLKPRVSVKADVSSGDDPRTGTLGTFSAIYPIGNYFGVLADTGPGPVNFIDVHPRLQLQLPHRVSVSTDLVVQWRQSLYDGVYAVPGFLLVPAGTSLARFVGYRPGVEARWEIDRHAYLQADYGVFYAGPFLKEAAPGRNIEYMALWAGYKF
jgi:Alginate export